MKNRHKKVMTAMVALLMVITALFSSSIATSADSNPASWILCRFEDGQLAYNAAATDLIPFTFRSKSAVSSNEDVDGGLFNGLLGLAGHNFAETNEHILGRELRPTSIPEVDIADANAAAPKVSAFDRFGVAGLKWSSYLGEWKYYQIDACSKGAQVSKTNYGSFYEGRQEPKSSYNDTGTSQDPRSMQFNRGLFASWGTAFMDMIANGLFTVTKLVVTLTITIVGLAFGDITSVIGLTSDGSAGVSAAGMFTTMFNSIFTGFVLITFTLTALYIMYQGLIKRQFRLAITTIFKTVLIFVIAIIISTNPAYWIGVPNKVATYGQSLVLNSMSSMKMGTSSDLCSTDVGSVNLEIKGTSDFERINKEMQSKLGCKMWEEMLLKPWVRGQFGVEYEDMEASKLNNINGEWVGDAAVPIGGGKYINNWALFHLSTQTTAHAPIDGNVSTYVTGVNSDWWRIADALSNYHEEKVTTTPDGGVGSVTHPEQVDAQPMDMWQSWIGNNTSERVGVAFTSIMFGIIGSLAPLVLGFTSAIMGAGITILMIFSPVFLLFGTWGGRGEQMFLGWLSALASTVMKKVVVSILLILSISLTMAGMELVNSIGVLKSMIMLSIFSAILIKNRKQILDALGRVDFGGIFDPRAGFNQAMDRFNKRAKQTTNIAVGTAAGAKAAKDTGQSISKGARVGGFHQFRNTLYQSQFGMNVSREYDNTRRGGKYTHESRPCNSCGLTIDEDAMIAFRDDYGNFYCQACGEEMDGENLYEVMIDSENKLTRNQKAIRKKEADNIKSRSTRRVDATSNSSWMSHSAMREQMNSVVVGDKHYWDNDNVEGMIKLNLKRLHEDKAVFIYNYGIVGEAARPPAIPEPLLPYLDIPLVGEAWTTNNHDLIDAAYREAWSMWYEENSAHIENASSSRRKEFLDELKTYEPNPDSEAAINRFNEKNGKLTSDEISFDRTEEDLFIYNDGMLISPKDSEWAEARLRYIRATPEERAELDRLKQEAHDAHKYSDRRDEKKDDEKLTKRD